MNHKHYKVINQDIAKIASGIVVHGCNAQGVMGSGVALAIRREWPAIFAPYAAFCKAANHSPFLLGTIQPNFITDDLVVVNAITQHTFGRSGGPYASSNAIKCALYTIGESVISSGKTWNIYMPLIGCGLGGLSWEDDVEPIVNEFAEWFGDHGQVYVCSIN